MSRTETKHYVSAPYILVVQEDECHPRFEPNMESKIICPSLANFDIQSKIARTHIPFSAAQIISLRGVISALPHTRRLDETTPRTVRASRASRAFPAHVRRVAAYDASNAEHNGRDEETGHGCPCEAIGVSAESRCVAG
jgi:hypothetical protein